MRIIVIGKSGQLASELKTRIPADVYAVFLGRTDIDLYSKEDISSKIRHFQPDVVINASAYTAVDKAESDVDAAYAINAFAVQYLVDACQDIDCQFIHVSTDFVFDGAANIAYRTDAVTNPLGTYGASKLAGENNIRAKKYYKSTIVRTSWVYSTFGNNFVKTMLRLMREKTEIGVVVDQIGSPTSASGLAKFLLALTNVTKLDEIYHWCDLGIASWFDFAVAIQEISYELGLLQHTIKINPIRTPDYPTPARRPHFSVLDASESQEIQNRVYWRDALYQTLTNLKVVSDEK